VTIVLAHGLETVRDLPVPRWLFFYGAAVALIASFVLLAALWRRPLLEGALRGRPLPDSFQRILFSRALRVLLGAVSFALFVIVTVAALFGTTSVSENLAPTFVYVVFWLGLVPASVLLGNVFSVLNPWKAAADAVASFVGEGESTRPYPERLGRWPAAALLFSFAALELNYPDSAEPRAIGLAILIYSAATWLGAAVFGRNAWFRNGDGFSVYFELLSRIAPFGVREGEGRREIVTRPPLVGLARPDPRPGTLAFVAIMLGSVVFDGFSQTSFWQDRIADLADVDAAVLAQTGLNLAGLVAAVALVALAYLTATNLAGRLVGQPSLADEFLLSLVPIAFVYAVAHYFTAFVIQGQFAISLASDPLGRGWDLFGSTDYRPDLTPFSPNTVWYVQVGALVLGHVAGLVLAHDRALAVTPDPRAALRTQYALLVLMVLYTVGGLWLLSRG
jgi:hypothetical protein